MASVAQITCRQLQRPHNLVLRAAPRISIHQNEPTNTSHLRHRSFHHYRSSGSTTQSTVQSATCPNARSRNPVFPQINQNLYNLRSAFRLSGTITSTRNQQRFFACRIAFQRRQYSTAQNPLDGVSEEASSDPKPLTLPRQLTPRPHENIYTIPNFLTFTRLLAAPAVGYFILTSQPLYALSLFFYAGVTDAVDGYLARRYNQQTVVGTVIDPMADKALMTISVVCLAIQGSIPVWLAVIILGRDIGLAISAIYFRWISLPPPKTMARYWDFSLPSAEVHPTEISKINTLLQLLLIGNAMVLPVLPAAWVELGNLQGIFEGWQVLVAGTTVWSGLSYLWNKDAVKILTREEIGKKMEEMGVEKERIEGEESKVLEGKEDKMV